MNLIDYMANIEIIANTNPKLGEESVKKKRKRKRGKKDDEKLCSEEVNENVESGREEKEFEGTKEVECHNEVKREDGEQGDESMKKKRKRKRGKKVDEKLCSEEVNENGESGVEEKEFEGTKEVECDNEVKREDEEQGDEIKKKKVKSGSGIMSSVTFESMSLSEPTMKAIKDMGFHYTTEVSNTYLFSYLS